MLSHTYTHEDASRRDRASRVPPKTATSVRELLLFLVAHKPILNYAPFCRISRAKGPRFFLVRATCFLLGKFLTFSCLRAPV